MPTRRSFGALGVVITALSLAALAHTHRSRAPRDALPMPMPRPEAHARAPGTAPVPGLAALRDGERLDLNAASPAELELLPGIGPRLAERILEHRARHGDFGTLGELTRVSGIGPRTLERLRPMLAVRGGDRSHVEEEQDAAGDRQVERIVIEGGEPQVGAQVQ